MVLAAVPANAANTYSEANWEAKLGLECEKYDTLSIHSRSATVTGTVVVKGGSVDHGRGPGITVAEVRGGHCGVRAHQRRGRQAGVCWIIECEDEFSSYS